MIQIYYYATTVPMPNSELIGTRVSYYSVEDNQYSPRHPIPSNAERLDFMDLTSFRDTLEFNQACLHLGARNVQNLILTPFLRNMLLYISEVNFFTGTVPEGACNPGMFDTTLHTTPSAPPTTTPPETTVTPAKVIAGAHCVCVMNVLVLQF